MRWDRGGWGGGRWKKGKTRADECGRERERMIEKGRTIVNVFANFRFKFFCFVVCVYECVCGGGGWYWFANTKKRSWNATKQLHWHTRAACRYPSHREKIFLQTKKNNDQPQTWLKYKWWEGAGGGGAQSQTKKQNISRKMERKSEWIAKKPIPKGGRKMRFSRFSFVFFCFFFYFQEQGGWEWVGGPIFLVSPIWSSPHGESQCKEGDADEEGGGRGHDEVEDAVKSWAKVGD